MKTMTTHVHTMGYEEFRNALKIPDEKIVSVQYKPSGIIEIHTEDLKVKETSLA